MENDSSGIRVSDDKQAVQHLTEVHSLLHELKSEISQHPKLEDAILRVELALSLLTTKSGGLL